MLSKFISGYWENSLWASLAIIQCVHFGLEQQMLPREFHVQVQSFLSTDPNKINSNVFDAFSNNPVTYLDKNGKAPESALQILTNQFGNRDEQYFRTFNAFLVYGAGQNGNDILGRVNNDAIYYYDWVRRDVDAQIRANISGIFPPGNNMPQLGFEVYSSGTRAMESRILSRPQPGLFQERYVRNAELPSVRSTPRFLSEQSTEIYLESSGHGRRIFEEEMFFWREYSEGLPSMYSPPRGEIFEGRPIFAEPQRRILRAEELAVLYEHPNFQYSQEFRGFLNYYSMPQPWAFPRDPGRQIAYQNYRRRSIRIGGAQNTEVEVPFQPLRFQP